MPEAGEHTCTPLETPGVPGGGRLSPLPRPGMNGPRPLHRHISSEDCPDLVLVINRHILSGGCSNPG